MAYYAIGDAAVARQVCKKPFLEKIRYRIIDIGGKSLLPEISSTAGVFSAGSKNGGKKPKRFSISALICLPVLAVLLGAITLCLPAYSQNAVSSITALQKDYYTPF